MGRDRLRILNCPAVLQVCCDSCCTERVAAGGGGESGTSGAALDHSQCVNTVHRPARERSAPVERLKERELFVSTQPQPDGIQVGIEVILGVVVCRYLVPLSALLVPSKPPSLSLLKVVLRFHSHGCANPCEGVDHHADQHPVAKAGNRRGEVSIESNSVLASFERTALGNTQNRPMRDV